MKVYVDELPKSCEECPMCRSGSLKLQKKGRYVEAHTCVFGQYKYQTIDDEIDTCPLKSLKKYEREKRNELIDNIIEKLQEANMDIIHNVDGYCYTRNFLDQMRNEEE